MKTLIAILMLGLVGCAGNQMQYRADQGRRMARVMMEMTPHEYCTSSIAAFAKRVGHVDGYDVSDEVTAAEQDQRSIWQKKFASLEECKAWVPGRQAEYRARFEGERQAMKEARAEDQAATARRNANYSKMFDGIGQMGSAPAVFGNEQGQRKSINCTTVGQTTTCY